MCLGDIHYKTCNIYMHPSSTNGIISSSVRVVNIIELNPPKIIQLWPFILCDLITQWKVENWTQNNNIGTINFRNVVKFSSWKNPIMLSRFVHLNSFMNCMGFFIVFLYAMMPQKNFSSCISLQILPICWI
jgi:hypothetical protein